MSLWHRCIARRAALLLARLREGQRAVSTDIRPQLRSSRVTMLPRGMSAFPSSTPRQQGSGGMTAKLPNDDGRQQTDSYAIHRSPPTSDREETDEGARGNGGSCGTSEMQRQGAGALPAWPVDALEFNAAVPHGGHDLRLRQATMHQPYHDCCPPLDSGIVERVVPKVVPVSASIRHRLLTSEETAEGQAALRKGGWVCVGCWKPVQPPSPTDGGHASSKDPLTICPHCWTLRHDAASDEKARQLREAAGGEAMDEGAGVVASAPDLWICSHCGEINRQHRSTAAAADLCRCCSSSRTDREEQLQIHRLTLAEEIQQSPIGQVTSMRNRTSRWRCSNCKEINSLQARQCRHCQAGRFSITLLCGSCNRHTTLSNEAVYGPAASPSFGLSNCFPPNAPAMRCSSCAASLHGSYTAATVGSGPSWWCACGLLNPSTTYSCTRCRLPRLLPHAATLERLLSSPVSPSPPASTFAWDFRNCTSWLCDVCDGVNAASRQTVVWAAPLPSGTGASDPKQARRRRARMLHGDSKCRHCGTAWHHLRSADGLFWRCACHALNDISCADCTACGLPAMDELSVDLLSTWARGDWRCLSCRRHVYRDRVRCVCGTNRPKPSATNTAEGSRG